VVAEAVSLARRHLRKIDSAQRRRLFTLLVRARGRPRSLVAAERRELLYLAARLEPRMLLGTAVRRVSPLPLPKRLLYGPARQRRTSGSVAPKLMCRPGE